MTAREAAATPAPPTPRPRLRLGSETNAPRSGPAEIEAQAAAARAEAIEHAQLAAVDTVDVFELVTLLVGPVGSVPNLTAEGRRVAGLLDCTGPVPRVFYEAYDPVVRQRFSLAHELGHYWLHAQRGRFFGNCTPANLEHPESDDQDDQAEPADDGDGEPHTEGGNSSVPEDEAAANAFAAAFLVPADALREAVATYGFSSAFLAERFGVSRTVVRHRWSLLQALAGEEGVQDGTEPSQPTVEGAPA